MIHAHDEIEKKLASPGLEEAAEHMKLCHLPLSAERHSFLDVLHGRIQRLRARISFLSGITFHAGREYPGRESRPAMLYVGEGANLFFFTHQEAVEACESIFALQWRNGKDERRRKQTP